ncbi:MAG: beta-ketoacyl-[acyl-carrier-protein] synthase II [Planctomycetota bacterium]|nr:MAG: beta-ketoacyl-[acyl-carrier-protein] synthase II [Planctomycetota bacterium]
MSSRRVVITGLGVISPLGDSLEAFWNGLLEGKNAIRSITSFPTDNLKVKFAAEIPDFDPTKYIPHSEVKKMDRVSHFAVAAASLAIQDGNLNLDELDRQRIGVIFGTGIGGIVEHWEQTMIYLDRGPRRVSPFFIPRLMPNACPANIAITKKLYGPNFSVNTACASAATAEMLAAMHIETGLADIIITGGSEATICPLAISGFANCRALSTRNDSPETACRPFDKTRDGFVMGEGAGALVFEELEHAKKRGAKIYAEVKGWAMTDDGYHITAPEPSGKEAIRCIRMAIEKAGIRPEDISYINAHGTSTPYNDRMETRAIKQVFGDYAYKIPISSTKSMIGHLIGAAGAVELVATSLSVVHDKIHPTINYHEPDPECDLDYVPNKARDHQVNYALSNSFGFGGHNATIIIGKYKE